ncbi:MAG: HDOD domain-containing protein [Desulfobulbaceae bacterium]|nr:HDOD domain-containing protein [Desulfobulbaceae bacterium]
MEDKTRVLLREFSKIRTLPHNIVYLSQLINDPNTTLEEIEEVVRIDPVLTGKVLTLVNSAYFGLGRRVDSISRAVAFLGLKKLHAIAMTDAMKNIFYSPLVSSSMDPERLWTHSAASAICSKLISERIFACNGDEAYMCGILHDIGLIVESQTCHQDFLKLYKEWDPENDPGLLGLEDQFLHTNHCILGYYLIREWNLPESIALGVRKHHAVDEEIDPGSHAGILQISNYFVNQLGYGIKPGATSGLSESVSRHVLEFIEEYKTLADDLPDEIESIHQLYA